MFNLFKKIVIFLNVSIVLHQGVCLPVCALIRLNDFSTTSQVNTNYSNTSRECRWIFLRLSVSYAQADLVGYIWVTNMVSSIMQKNYNSWALRRLFIPGVFVIWWNIHWRTLQSIFFITIGTRIITDFLYLRSHDK